FSSGTWDTSFSRDGGSDVCSSDLPPGGGGREGRSRRPSRAAVRAGPARPRDGPAEAGRIAGGRGASRPQAAGGSPVEGRRGRARPVVCRVGAEGRSGLCLIERVRM